MHRFEQDAIEVMIGHGILAPDVRRQLGHTTVSRRSRDADAHTAYFAVDEAAPAIVPGDAELAADLDVDGYGTITATLAIADGRLKSLSFESPDRHWPERPRILGLVPWPAP